MTHADAIAGARPGDDVVRGLQSEAVDLLQALLRVDTANRNETAAAILLQDYLRTHGVECELVARDPSRANLVARLPGRGTGPSLALVGHTDVVPADARDWTHPPFSGHLDSDGFLWGRGACDMKNEVVTRAVALAHLARTGFQPNGDLLLLAVADEEVGVDDIGMSWLVKQRPDIGTDYALNEGAAERLELADGRTVVTLHVGEKGAMQARVTALGEPAPSTLITPGSGAIPRLATLIGRLDRYQPRRRESPTLEALLHTLVPGAERDDVGTVLAKAVALHPAFADLIAPLFALTICPTMLHGSSALNVSPSRASVDCDCRTVPGMSTQDALDELTDALGGDAPCIVECIQPVVGGSSSTLDSPLFDACRSWVATNDPDALVIPTYLNGFTDSHYLREAFGTVAYGFWPVRSTPYEVMVTGIHGNDERVHIDDLGYATAFHVAASLDIGTITGRTVPSEA